MTSLCFSFLAKSMDRDYTDLLQGIIAEHYWTYDAKFLRLQEKLLTGAKIITKRFGDTTAVGVVIVLENGYTVFGQASCVDPDKFNMEIGVEWALKDALVELDPIVAWLVKDGWKPAQKTAAKE